MPATPATTAILIYSSFVLLSPKHLPLPLSVSAMVATATRISSSSSSPILLSPKHLLCPFRASAMASTATIIYYSSVLLSPKPLHGSSLPPISASLSLQNPRPNANPSPILKTPNPNPFLSASTRTLTSLVALAKLLLHRLVSTPPPPQISHVLSLSGPLFFAALRDRPSGYLNTPLTVVASGMAKWLDIYSGVLMVRVLLSWFPNIPWDSRSRPSGIFATPT